MNRASGMETEGIEIERMYAYSVDHDDKDQYAYYGKTAGCVVTSNEDNIKHCSMDILYAMSHIGYMVPQQADCEWIGGPKRGFGAVKVEVTIGKTVRYTSLFPDAKDKSYILFLKKAVRKAEHISTESTVNFELKLLI